MIRYVGLDVHKPFVQACVVDEQGRTLLTQRVDTTHAALTAFAQQQLRRSDQVALEATTNCWAVAKLLRAFVDDVAVSNPLQTKAIAQAKIKTDKVDAHTLAQLLRCDYLPKVWMPDEPTQLLRTLTHHRAALVAERTRLKNRIHSLLHQLLRPIDVDLFSKKGRELLRGMDLPKTERSLIDSDLRLLAQVETEIATLDQELVQHAYADARVKLLMTLPGVDYTIAQTLLAALGDLSRFPDGDHAASYLGLVPSTKQSANHCYHGRITKQGNTHARWMLVQAAQRMAIHPGPLGVFFRRLAKKKNRNVAVVASARKLVVIAYHMLKNNEPYRYAQPAPTQNKLARLRVRAAGVRKTRGPKKGSAPSTNYGTGRRTREIPSLPQLLSSESLPAVTPLDQLPAGEQRHLRESGVARFVEEIQHPKRVPRRSKSDAAQDAERSSSRGER